MFSCAAAALQMYSFLTGLFVQAVPLSAEVYEALLSVFMHVKSKDLIISLFPDAALKGFFLTRTVCSKLYRI